MRSIEMTKYTPLTKKDIFRDTKTLYAKTPRNLVSAKHLAFCKRYTGKRILDFGCATGDYCLELSKSGFECTGVDINQEYVSLAIQKGVSAIVVNDKLPFKDGAFDTVIMIEVLEHVNDVDIVLQEVKRIARKNVLITVPNCTDYDVLRKSGLVYEHFLELDHVNFFTRDSLIELLRGHFANCKVFERVPVSAYKLLSFPFLYYAIGALHKLSIIKPRYFTHLFALAEK